MTTLDLGDAQQARAAVEQALRRATQNPQAIALLANLDKGLRAADLQAEPVVSPTDFNDEEHD